MTSANDGSTWTSHGEPCPQTDAGEEIDSVALAQAPTGSLAVLCEPRLNSRERGLLATAANGDQRFRPSSVINLGDAPIGAFAASSSTTVMYSDASGTFRTTNRGHTFARTRRRLLSIGFATASTGYAVPADQRHILITVDSGQSWRPITIR